MSRGEEGGRGDDRRRRREGRRGEEEIGGAVQRRPVLSGPESSESMDEAVAVINELSHTEHTNAY